MLLGLTGKRYVGKSTVANYLVEEYGFVRMHTFGMGLAMAYTYFERITEDPVLAHRMTYGDLKDVPSPHLPDNEKPRIFLERLGAFIPRELGIEWTMGAELDRTIRHNPEKHIIVESVVYEADYFRSRGGKIIRLTRPGHEGPVGEKTDAVQVTIQADFEIINQASLDILKMSVQTIVNDLL